MKLLWYGESPFIETGAGQVAKHLLPVFQQFFDNIHLVAINQWWEPQQLPDEMGITLCTPEMCFNEENAKSIIAAGDYDVLFLTTDLNRITDLQEEIQQGAVDRDVPIIMYAAMDTHIYTRKFWNVLSLATVPVVFTNWCKRQCELILPDLAKKLQVIYHGCEPDVFYPLSTVDRQQIRRDMFGITDNTFLVINVNRNQVRKDLMRTMAAFHLFHMKCFHSVLYLHAKHSDLGGNIIGQAEYLGMDIRSKKPEVIFSPDNYHELTGVSREDLNRIYNAADVAVSTSTGEGWGLTTTEAMAAGTPFIGPNNTVFPEILGDGKRGLLVESGGPDLWATFYGVSDTPREICSTTGMMEALEDVYHNRDTAIQRASVARLWTERHTWEQVQQEWMGVLSYVIEERVLSKNNIIEYKERRKSRKTTPASSSYSNEAS
jgi:glycosyltransferase involved in cell wall biosynthesis